MGPKSIFRGRKWGPYIWEVLNGVGVDGVGGIFPFFSFFFAFSFFVHFLFVFLRFFFFRFSSLFFAFFPILLEQGQTTAIYWENGEFHSDPVCTDPVRNFPIHGNQDRNSWAVFQGIFKRENDPLRHLGKRPIQVRKRTVKEGKCPLEATGLFSGTQPWWWKTAPQKKTIHWLDS